MTGLLGPSGSGKSTLMRAIVGVQRIAAGRVSVLGLPAGSVAARERVGYVTQAPSIYGDLTVHENVAYFAAIVGAEPGQTDEADRCDRLLLLRDGQLLAETTPAALRSRTGAVDLDEAFLRLINNASTA